MSAATQPPPRPHQRPGRLLAVVATVSVLAAGMACGPDRSPADDAAPPAPSSVEGTAGADALLETPTDEDTVNLPGAWTEPPVRGDGDGGAQAVLQDLRVATHDGFDRLVLDFANGPLPPYDIEYLDGPATRCGSGEPVDPGGAHALQVALLSAVAHTEQGAPTVQLRERQPDLPNLRSLKLICDFEGHVDWLAGLVARSAIRVTALRNPTRLVVDIAHPDTVQAQHFP